MSKEKNQKAYDSVDTDVLADKMGDAAMQLLKGNMPDGEDFFGYIRENFTPEECIYITAVHMAKSVEHQLTTNPAIRAMTGMMRNLQDEVDGDDVLKTVKDILNKGKR